MADPRTADRMGEDGPGAFLPLAGFAAPIRWAGTICLAIAGLVAAALVAMIAAGEAAAEVGMIIPPAVFVGLGVLLRSAGRRLAAGKVPDLPRLAGAVFLACGGAMALGGLVMVFDDPAGFALIAFGLVFVGAGYLARRLFAVPRGKKAVLVDRFEAATRRLEGRPSIRRQASVLHVDENASAAEIDAARTAWLRERWAERPDWVTGTILPEEVRRSGLLPAAATLWSVFALGALAVALYWGDTFAWFVAGGGAVFAVSLLGRVALRSIRQRKFGETRLTLRRTPAVLGGRLAGEIATGVPQSAVLRDGFRLALRCVHRWEETDRNRQTIPRREVLWQTEQGTSGRAPSGSRFLSVPFDLALPADRPATTLGGDREGIVWELDLSAAVPGVDYEATFHVPVLEPEAGAVLGSASGNLVKGAYRT